MTGSVGHTKCLKEEPKCGRKRRENEEVGYRDATAIKIDMVSLMITRVNETC